MSTSEVAGSLRGSYPAMLAIAVAALSPFIVSTTADLYYRGQIALDLGASKVALGVLAGMATGAYAFGALFGADMINRFSQRRVFLFAEAIFILGAVASATAPDFQVYAGGRIVEGLTTGVLLVAAFPPVIRRFPAKRLPITVIFVNMGFFGSVTAGPVIGGIVSSFHAARWLEAAIACVALAAWLLAFVTLEPTEPQNPDMPVDAIALFLALAATAAPFFATGMLARTGFASPVFWAPMAGGLAALIALLVVEYRKKEPLSPVAGMWTTFPIVGALTAMFGGATSVTVVVLSSQYLLKTVTLPKASAGLSFWPEIAGAVAAACMLGLVIRTRLLPLYILGGMALLIAGGALIAAPGEKTTYRFLIAAALLGLGSGASVSPGLYLAGFSLPSALVGRILAMIELVRSIADFVLSPVMIEIGKAASAGTKIKDAGLSLSIWITLALAAAMTAFGAAIYLLGRPGWQKPDLEGWLAQRNPALRSPPLLAAVRRKRKAEARLT